MGPGHAGHGHHSQAPVVHGHHVLVPHVVPVQVPTWSVEIKDSDRLIVFSSFRLWFWNSKLILFFSTVKVTAVTVNHSIGKATPGCLGGLRVETYSNGKAMLRRNTEVFGVYQAKASHQI